jgi:hypothetical protein
METKRATDYVMEAETSACASVFSSIVPYCCLKNTHLGGMLVIWIGLCVFARVSVCKFLLADLEGLS